MNKMPRLEIYIALLLAIGIHCRSTVLGFVPYCPQSRGTSGSTATASFFFRQYLQRPSDTPTDTPTTTSYNDTDAASQGIVSSLTELVNRWSDIQGDGRIPPTSSSSTQRQEQQEEERTLPPRTVQELQQRLAQDYVQNNYLWTGQLDLSCFEPTCRFTDPTLTFEGTDTYQKNVNNLVPWVEPLVQNSQSILLDITATSNYIETRWNMVGEFNTLFWKPKIDVIGRTKFWFRTNNEEDQFLRVYEYDEKWEIPAYQALLQLVTPAGTFSNTTRY